MGGVTFMVVELGIEGCITRSCLWCMLLLLLLQSRSIFYKLLFDIVGAKYVVKPAADILQRGAVSCLEDLSPVFDGVDVLALQDAAVKAGKICLLDLTMPCYNVCSELRGPSDKRQPWAGEGTHWGGEELLTSSGTPAGRGGLSLGSSSVGCVEKMNCGVWL